MTRRRRIRRIFAPSRLWGESGTAVIEFAVVVPVLLLIVLGITDFGRAMNYRNAVTQLANEAARFASVNRDPVSGNAPTCASLKSYLATQADTPELAAMITNGTLAIDFRGTPGNVGDPVQLKLTVNFPWAPFISTKALNGATNFGIPGTATMRLEQPPGFGAGSC